MRKVGRSLVSGYTQPGDDHVVNSASKRTKIEVEEKQTLPD